MSIITVARTATPGAVELTQHEAGLLNEALEFQPREFFRGVNVLTAAQMRQVVRALEGTRGEEYTKLWRLFRYAGGAGHDDRGAECPPGCLAG